MASFRIFPKMCKTQDWYWDFITQIGVLYNQKGEIGLKSYLMERNTFLSDKQQSFTEHHFSFLIMICELNKQLSLRRNLGILCTYLKHQFSALVLAGAIVSLEWNILNFGIFFLPSHKRTSSKHFSFWTEAYYLNLSIFFCMCTVPS